MAERGVSPRQVERNLWPPAPGFPRLQFLFPEKKQMASGLRVRATLAFLIKHPRMDALAFAS